MTAPPPLASELYRLDNNDICLSCLLPIPAVEGVMPPHRTDRHGIVACRGSGFPPHRHDGRDDMRRLGIARHREIAMQVNEKRAEIQHVMADKGWSFVAVMSTFGPLLVPLETQLGLWKELGNHGDIGQSVICVLRSLAEGDRISQRHGWLRQGYRAFLDNATTPIRAWLTSEGARHAEALGTLLLD